MKVRQDGTIRPKNISCTKQLLITKLFFSLKKDQNTIVFLLYLKKKMIQRIYIDTSVVGGYFDDEFKEVTNMLFQRLENREVKFVVSDLLDLELINAPTHVKELLFKYSTDFFERVELTVEALQLADTYIEEKVVGKTSIEDCRHIALATIYKVDVLASWNFKHIVNLDRIKGYNSVNLRLGYAMIEIRSPKDLIKYGED